MRKLLVLAMAAALLAGVSACATKKEAPCAKDTKICAECKGKKDCKCPCKKEVKKEVRRVEKMK
ncbi:MAG: hypothetical protein PHX68_04735 [Alphaproteobacteria bacterium]|nr:hypothetical protein [Alphaproteobacteria bacterium]